MAIHNLACVRDERQLFSGLNEEFAPGDGVQIEGSNGAGKTLLLRILAGLTPPDAGEIRWRQRPLRQCRSDYYRELVYIGHRAAIKPVLTPRENLTFYQGITGLRNDYAIYRALEQVGLLGYEDVRAAGLSAGQQQRIALARLWLTSASLWILDEPLTAIDHQGAQALVRLFEQHCATGGMVIMTTHQPLPASRYRMRKVALRMAEATSCFG
ncbi:Cytochrome c biogenesis ATP-binding export protein CcmA [Sodalis glossinidius str. 'morsitans']|uniref:Cytochrome c biogenesis ATP-binding export protein CcmA n=2 Tax=Sodalis glossinidius (strain morsitans) TaxID=343509 RepID=CCMA_SODGM|nr:cytochrome c biogenesis heme-transporting ATPase CcmA [Sodalis glossinidius]Q2NSG3.1 RecName: Full=Cytochrome c biogenesis ATP-binding export protein CcmA; AltName: Full=Heme exporter protein A [Sodalis glossinidius str. 'morsitans']BAE74912.1 heme exporter protein A [Sodalis glossinidius str. 'morsitans']CRL45761.1 Cytochrome c biogenesis ATP-binding export protein CcmA [Sodalis glossinidius str. 'morsitans']